MFDPDWNPAVDKQAAARCWRDGQRKRCFTYRFLATGTVEEKIFQRQLSKEGLQSVVDDKEQVNTLSTKDLRNLFKLRTGTPSDTHDKLRCERCEIIHDNAEIEALKVLPKKLAACKELLEMIVQHEDSKFFLDPLDAILHGKTKEEFDKLVKQPMDLGTIRKKLELPPDNSQAYRNVSGYSKDVNRIFSNVMKVWSPGDDIADAARQLQGWWIDQWTKLVPRLMAMQSDQDEVVAAESGDATTGEVDVFALSASVHNERGDNYQEQIGMPDEENMRSWSHHYSTDTVDDPVFRAAMRGSDAVSFVFGLEVTWSLIQQRQQEEEERLAAQALQEVGEDENCDEGQKVGVVDCGTTENDGGEGSVMVGAVAFGATEDDGGEDAEPEVTAVVAGGPVDGDNEGDDTSEPEARQGKAPSATTPEQGSSPRPSTTQASSSTQTVSTSASGEESPTTTQTDSERSSLPRATRKITTQLDSVATKSAPDSKRSAPCDAISSSTETDNSQLSQDSTSPEKENAIDKEAVVESNGWACGTCTLLNKATLRKCVACGAKNSSRKATKKRRFDDVNS